MTLTSVVIMILCATSSKAQEIKITEKLSTDYGTEYIVIIDNIEYRAINGSHAKDISKLRVNLDACNQNTADWKHAFELSQKDVSLITSMYNNEKLLSASWQRSYELENALRLKSETLQGRGKISSFFDNPFVQVATKAAVPVLNIILAKQKH